MRWLTLGMLALAGCSLFRANPLDQNRGAIVLVFDTRTAGDLKTLRQELSAAGARATVFADGRIESGTARMLMDLRSEGHEIGLSGLKGVDAESYSQAYGRQKYFQDEIVTQVLDAERQGLNMRHFLLRLPAYAKKSTLQLPEFLVSKGFERVVAVAPNYILPQARPAHELAKPVVHAQLMSSNFVDRAQIAALVKRNEVLVVRPSRKALPALLEEVRAQGVPFATLADLKVKR